MSKSMSKRLSSQFGGAGEFAAIMDPATSESGMYEIVFMVDGNMSVVPVPTKSLLLLIRNAIDNKFSIETDHREYPRDEDASE